MILLISGQVSLPRAALYPRGKPNCRAISRRLLQVRRSEGAARLHLAQITNRKCRVFHRRTVEAGGGGRVGCAFGIPVVQGGVTGLCIFSFQIEPSLGSQPRISAVSSIAEFILKRNLFPKVWGFYTTLFNSRGAGTTRGFF